MKISIIGGGRLGTTLGKALARRGYSLLAVGDRTPALAAQARQAIGRGRAAPTPAQAARHADVLFLCVPDDALAAAARSLSRSDLKWRGKTVFHCSGLLTSRVLAPLRRQGASVGSFHPVQAFPKKGMRPSVFRGIFIGLEGDRTARTQGRRIALSLGACAFSIRPSEKPLYHTACSLASNHIVILFHLAAGLLSKTGLSARRAEEVLWPLLQGTLQNVNVFGSATALTGPLVRGDAATLARHLGALKNSPALSRVYKLLSLEGLKMARFSGSASLRSEDLSRLMAGK